MNKKEVTPAKAQTAMFKRNILDYALLDYLQKEILPTLPNKHQFKSLASCNNIIIPTPYGQTPDVQVMKADEGKAAKFWGLGHCGNTFYCPVCEAKRMADHALKIGAAIDGLEQKHGKVAFMLTLTLIHHKHMKILDLQEILADAWRRFKGDKGIRGTHHAGSTMIKFCREFNCTHYVRAIEMTYSTKKGWNPHIHALFWIDKKRLQEVAEWEPLMRKTWRTVLANAWAKYFSSLPGENEKHDKKTNVEYWMSVFNRLHSYATEKAKVGKASKRNADAQGLWISKTKTGKISRAFSSSYISGWGGDLELTGKPRKKASGKDSMTIHQLLQAAHNGDAEAKEKYIEFMQAMKKKRRRRVMYSKDLVNFIREWTSTHEYKTTLLKKTQSIQTTWYSFISISPRDWQKILAIEHEKKVRLRCDILYLTANYDAATALELIYDYLLFFDIKITNNPNMWSKFAENLFNEKAFEEELRQEREQEAQWHKYDVA